MRDSFHNETDVGTTLRAGDVLRVTSGAFPDAVILGFADNGNVKCSRPYAYASSVGTTGPTVLLGAETIIYTMAEIGRYDKVGDRRETA
jgi:hypothetical protein